VKSAPVLSVNGVWKSYPANRKAARARLGIALRSAFSSGPPADIAPSDSHNWAVSDLSFRVGRGEALGVIGRNGAGKTTLLRMIAGQLRPDRGEIMIAGRSAALIALQAGLKPSASGRENIHLKSAIMGRRTEETATLEEEIIAFSELGDAIDRPVETYSSGMVVRLAFSTIIASRPDLLIVDETLAVGDFAFKQKCLARVREMKDQMALVLVSHSMGDVARFCDRVLVLDKGCVTFDGPPDAAIKHYHESVQAADAGARSPHAKSLIPAVVRRPEAFELIEGHWTDCDGTPLLPDTPARVQSGIGFECSFILHRQPRRLAIGIPIYSATGELLCGLSTDSDKNFADFPLHEPVRIHFSSPHMVLNPGRYRAALGVVDELEHLFMDELPDLQVASNGALTWGHFSWPGRWTIK
jgi:ABC-type polysaccharide/polyol phosphate transport system ATPase subunit